MKLALLGTRGYPSTYGGFETLVRFLAPYLRDEGHDVTVYCREDGRYGSDVADGIRRVFTRGHDSKSWSTLSYGGSSIAHASREGYDAVFVANVANGFFLPMLRRSGIPTVLNVDGIEWERDKWGRAAKTVFRVGANLSARYADTLVADAEAIGDRWRAEYGRDPVFIPYGAPNVQARPDTQRLGRLGLEPDGYALVVARLVPENNVETILDAFEGQNSRKLVVVGSANYDNPILKRLDVLQDAGVVLPLGHVDDQELLTDLWFHSFVVVHGHSVGGTNPALVQAMGTGAAVLAFDSVYNREVLKDAGTYWHNAASLQAALCDMTENSSRRQDMRELARLRVSMHYNWPDVCRRYLTVLERAATGTRE